MLATSNVPGKGIECKGLQMAFGHVADDLSLAHVTFDIL
jgi:hypothetical protein